MLRSSALPPGPAFGQPSPLSVSKPEKIPAWGELVKYDLEVEQPDEYVDFEPTQNRAVTWFFDRRQPEVVRGLLQAAGFTPDQVRSAMASIAVHADQTTTLAPTRDLIFSLGEAPRRQLYTELARSERNRYMRFPYCFMTNRAAAFLGKSELSSAVIERVEQLTYQRNGNYYFSDVEAVVNEIATAAERQMFFKVLSRSSVVMARLRVRPDTDIDKLLGYWSANNSVRQKDLRPLLESFKRRDQGGTVSLVYFLPPFARERLFTSPLPSQPGDPTMDCHWSAMNFFNAEPDYRFSDLSYTSGFVKTNFYQVASPSSYGDIVFLLDDRGNAVHSAVYIADDIVFTKNGNNYAQPWVLMRLPNLVALYSVTDTPRVACYRNKNS